MCGLPAARRLASILSRLPALAFSMAVFFMNSPHSRQYFLPRPGSFGATPHLLHGLIKSEPHPALKADPASGLGRLGVPTTALGTHVLLHHCSPHLEQVGAPGAHSCSQLFTTSDRSRCTCQCECHLHSAYHQNCPCRWDPLLHVSIHQIVFNCLPAVAANVVVAVVLVDVSLGDVLLALAHLHRPLPQTRQIRPPRPLLDHW